MPGTDIIDNKVWAINVSKQGNQMMFIQKAATKNLTSIDNPPMCQVKWASSLCHWNLVDKCLVLHQWRSEFA
jgi:hypothetical protein